MLQTGKMMYEKVDFPGKRGLNLYAVKKNKKTLDRMNFRVYHNLFWYEEVSLYGFR
jgi:hypothetical protein